MTGARRFGSSSAIPQELPVFGAAAVAPIGSVVDIAGEGGQHELRLSAFLCCLLP